MHRISAMLFDKPIAEYMTSNVASTGPDTTLAAVARMFDERKISAVPVVSPTGAPIGVISRTDLLRVGRIQAGSHRQASVLTLPQKTAGELIGDA